MGLKLRLYHNPHLSQLVMYPRKCFKRLYGVVVKVVVALFANIKLKVPSM